MKKSPLLIRSNLRPATEEELLNGSGERERERERRLGSHKVNEERPDCGRIEVENLVPLHLDCNFFGVYPA